jgi:hypothetical protein
MAQLKIAMLQAQSMVLPAMQEQAEQVAQAQTEVMLQAITAVMADKEAQAAQLPLWLQLESLMLAGS